MHCNIRKEKFPMMTKLFEKWSAALVFAILLHLGVIFLLYINSYENRTNDMEHSRKSTEEIISTNIENNHLSAKTQTQITTLDTAKKHLDIDHIQVKDLSSSEKIIIEIETKIPNKSLEITNYIPAHSVESETTNHQKLQKNNDKLEKERNINVLPSNFYRDDLAYIKDDVGLLNIDIPIPNSEPKIEREYNLIKSEIEETNDKLSDAINEVKKYNQRKIDDIQQKNNEYIHNSENNNLIDAK